MRASLAVIFVIALSASSVAARAQEPTSRTWASVNVVGQATREDSIPSELSASLDVFADLPLGATLLHLYVEGATTPSRRAVSTTVPFANMDAGTALDDDGTGRVQVSELRVALPAGARTTLHAGLMDLTGFLDVSRIANDENLFFLAQPFVNNPTILFPDYTLGTVFLVDVPSLPHGQVAVSVSSSHGLAELPDASHRHLFDLGGQDRGAFVATRMEWEGESVEGSLGLWHSTGDRFAATEPGRLLPTRGVYTVLGWRSGPSALNLRLGRSTGAGTTEPFVGVTYLGEVGANAVGIGLARTPALPEAVGRLGSHGEAFLRRSLAGVVYLTTSVQWLSDTFLPPSVSAEGTWIFGLRASATFR